MTSTADREAGAPGRLPRRQAALVAVVLLALMAGFGVGVYRTIGHFRHTSGAVAAGGTGAAPALAPTTTRPQVTVPGTVYLTQDGSLYRLSGTTFTRVGPAGLSQPAMAPDGQSLVAVLREAESSDIVRMDLGSGAVQRLTHNAAPARDTYLGDNHWAFTPRLSADGTTLFLAYDMPKQGYQVDLDIWSQPARDTPKPARQWSTANRYTGGDLTPVPVPSGGVVFSRHAIDAGGSITSQLWFQATPAAAPTALTDAADGCREPALSADGASLAMVCSRGEPQRSDLVVAPFTPGRLLALRTVDSSRLCAVPAWSPDGTDLVYLAPAAVGAPFQLWWQKGAATAGTAPQQVTTQLALDATSAPAWGP